MGRELVTSNWERERAANQCCSHSVKSSCGSEGTPPPGSLEHPGQAGGVGAAPPLQQLPKELEEGVKDFNRNLGCSGINLDFDAHNWGDVGERGLRAFLNWRLSGAVAQGREIMAEFNE